MYLKRRNLLKFTATIPLTLLPVASTKASEIAVSLAYIRLKHSSTEHLYSPGDYLIIDTTQSEFKGNGIYLYPSWGEPSPYLVKRLAEDSLAYCNPDTGKMLWQQSLGQQFAGRLIKHIPEQDSRGESSLLGKIQPYTPSLIPA